MTTSPSPHSLRSASSASRSSSTSTKTCDPSSPSSYAAALTACLPPNRPSIRKSVRRDGLGQSGVARRRRCGYAVRATRLWQAPFTPHVAMWCEGNTTPVSLLSLATCMPRGALLGASRGTDRQWRSSQSTKKQAGEGPLRSGFRQRQTSKCSSSNQLIRRGLLRLKRKLHRAHACERRMRLGNGRNLLLQTGA